MAIHVLDAMAREGFEQVVALHDRDSGMRAFLAVHDTTRGPAFGGVRRWNYLDEDQALRDCLRLSRAMSYKCALAGLPAGGAKMVLLERPDTDFAAAYRCLGRVVEGWGGRFYTGPDVGTGAQELAWMAETTQYVTRPGPEGPGELAASTCAGVLAGIEAALLQLDGRADWPRRTIVVQGLGEVGLRVARSALELGARVLGVDPLPERAEAAAALGVEVLEPSSEFDPECDVFAPCALGGLVHDLTLPRLRCRVLAGAANNVLARPGHGDRLHERGILYVPDFVINAGGLIRGAVFHMTGEREPVESIGARVGRVTGRILALAAERDLPPMRVAQSEAERFRRAGSEAEILHE